MGLTWPWWYPKDATFEDFFQFLPRRRMDPPSEMGRSEIRLEITNTERLLKTAEREQEELSALLEMRLKMKDTQLSEFQVLLEDIFFRSQYFSHLDSSVALPQRFLEMLERLHSLRTSLGDHMGE